MEMKLTDNKNNFHKVCGPSPKQKTPGFTSSTVSCRYMKVILFICGSYMHNFRDFVSDGVFMKCLDTVYV